MIDRIDANLRVRERTTSPYWYHHTNQQTKRLCISRQHRGYIIIVYTHTTHNRGMMRSTMTLLRHRYCHQQRPSKSTLVMLWLILVIVVASSPSTTCSLLLSAVVAFSWPCSITTRTHHTHTTSPGTMSAGLIASRTSRWRNNNNFIIMAKKSTTAKTATSNSEDEGIVPEDDASPSPIVSPSFIIREVQEDDLGAAANILADSFTSNKGFWAQRVERMNTYLSLKSRFETFRYAERSGALQCMLVATKNNTNNNNNNEQEIVAFCEVDNRPPGGEINPAPRPYISNLAVQDAFRRRGVATALVAESEEIVRESWSKPRLYLRVEKDNDAARIMYEKCGYLEQVVKEEEDSTSSSGTSSLLLAKTLY